MGIAWHAPYELLKPETRDLARALHSLMEELEAIDWYGQRMDVTDDVDLRRTLEHNRDEEKEHAAMVLEWIRRHDQKFDQYLRQYLFTAGDVLAIEEASDSGGASEARSIAPHLPVTEASHTTQETLHVFTVGSLRPKR
ncbi:MAG TPA: encapsulin-associated ferritin-like protein [Blastocatellia bacterium]|nr:encapsulin-associated ferritin-like protein [Blastocatellia bacterium]